MIIWRSLRFEGFRGWNIFIQISYSCTLYFIHDWRWLFGPEWVLCKPYLKIIPLFEWLCSQDLTSGFLWNICWLMDLTSGFLWHLCWLIHIPSLLIWWHLCSFDLYTSVVSTSKYFCSFWSWILLVFILGKP